MCNLYSITTNKAAIIALFRVLNRYVGNLPPMPVAFDGEGTRVRLALPRIGSVGVPANFAARLRGQRHRAFCGRPSDDPCATDRSRRE